MNVRVAPLTGPRVAPCFSSLLRRPPTLPLSRARHALPAGHLPAPALIQPHCTPLVPLPRTYLSKGTACALSKRCLGCRLWCDGLVWRWSATGRCCHSEPVAVKSPPLARADAAVSLACWHGDVCDTTVCDFQDMLPLTEAFCCQEGPEMPVLYPAHESSSGLVQMRPLLLMLPRRPWLTPMTQLSGGFSALSIVSKPARATIRCLLRGMRASFMCWSEPISSFFHRMAPSSLCWLIRRRPSVCLPSLSFLHGGHGPVSTLSCFPGMWKAGSHMCRLLCRTALLPTSFPILITPMFRILMSTQMRLCSLLLMMPLSIRRLVRLSCCAAPCQ